MFKHLLVPTDDSELSDDTVQKAVDFAADAGAKITFFHAKSPIPAGIYSEAALPEGAITNAPEAYARAADAEAAKLLGGCEDRAKPAGVAYESRIAVTREPYEAIIAAAKDAGCDLIFMASHGRRGVAGLLIGSETQKVLTYSKIPVLVCR